METDLDDSMDNIDSFNQQQSGLFSSKDSQLKPKFMSSLAKKKSTLSPCLKKSTVYQQGKTESTTQTLDIKNTLKLPMNLHQCSISTEISGNRIDGGYHQNPPNSTYSEVNLDRPLQSTCALLRARLQKPATVKKETELPVTEPYWALNCSTMKDADVAYPPESPILRRDPSINFGNSSDDSLFTGHRYSQGSPLDQNKLKESAQQPSSVEMLLYWSKETPSFLLQSKGLKKGSLE